MSVSIPDLIAALNQLGIQVPSNVAIQVLTANVRDSSSPDMGGGNYQMTVAEAAAAFISPSNYVEGSTLTWPAGGAWAVQQVVSTLGKPAILVAYEGSGYTSILPENQLTEVVALSGLGVFDLNNFIAITARSANNGYNTDAVSDYTVGDADAGTLITMNPSVSGDMIIPDGLKIENCCFDVCNAGVGAVTITGSSILGNAVLTAGKSCKVQRKGTYDIYQVLYN